MMLTVDEFKEVVGSTGFVYVEAGASLGPPKSGDTVKC